MGGFGKMPHGLENRDVLVTGGTGFLGRCLARRLTPIPGIKLTLLSRRPRPADAPPTWAWVEGYLADLTPSFWKDRGFKGFDHVFHLGGFTPKNPPQADDLEHNYRDNLQGTRMLLESLPRQPQRFTFASSLDVYAPPADGQRISETSPLGPAFLYGASKLMGESILGAMGRKTGLGFTLLRYGHLYGPGEEAYGKLIPESIRRLKRNEGLKVFGSGGALRDYLFVEDAVEATLQLSVLDETRGETINVVRGQSHSVRQVLEVLTGLGGFENKIESDFSQPEGANLCFDHRKLLRFIPGWRPLGLEEGLTREWTAWKEKRT
jgi:UDP-glucose 4-epimerase